MFCISISSLTIYAPHNFAYRPSPQARHRDCYYHSHILYGFYTKVYTKEQWYWTDGSSECCTSVVHMTTGESPNHWKLEWLPSLSYKDISHMWPDFEKQTHVVTFDIVYISVYFIPRWYHWFTKWPNQLQTTWITVQT